MGMSKSTSRVKFYNIDANIPKLSINSFKYIENISNAMIYLCCACPQSRAVDGCPRLGVGEWNISVNKHNALLQWKHLVLDV